jgi:hypothetical protein
MGHESPGVGTCNLSNIVGSGRCAKFVKSYTGKMPRAARAQEQKLFISQKHESNMRGADSPGPAKYTPKATFWEDHTSKFAHNGGSVFGKSGRASLAKVAF